MALYFNTIGLERQLRRVQEERLRKFQEQQTKRFQEIRRILADPELVALLKDVFAAEVAGEDPAPVITPSPSDAPFPANEYEDENGDGRLERGAQIRAIRAAISRLGCEFSTPNIGDIVRSEGLAISNIAVGKALRRLEASDELRIVREGAGSEPHVYEKTDKFRAAGTGA